MVRSRQRVPHGGLADSDDESGNGLRVPIASETDNNKLTPLMAIGMSLTLLSRQVNFIRWPQGNVTINLG